MKICLNKDGLFLHEDTGEILTELEKQQVVAYVNACEGIPMKHLNKIKIGFYETYRDPYGLGNLYDSDELQELYEDDFRAGRRKSPY